MNRREFLKLGLTCAPLASVSIPFLSSECTENLELTQINIGIKDLPAEFIDYRIGFASDLHLGVNVSDDFIENSLNKLYQTKIDLLVLGGDFIFVPDSFIGDAFVRKNSPKYSNLDPLHANFLIFKTLTKIIESNTPPDGVISVYGNHDRWTHPTALYETFGKAKLKILVNETHSVRRGTAELTFIGVDDFLTGVPRMPKLPEEKTAPRILISHNPDFVGPLMYYNPYEIDFSMCGHTHGGQIAFPLLGTPLTNTFYKELASGFFKSDYFQSYTSRGVGTVEIPYRFGVRPEVSVFTLLKV